MAGYITSAYLHYMAVRGCDRIARFSCHVLPGLRVTLFLPEHMDASWRETQMRLNGAKAESEAVCLITIQQTPSGLLQRSPLSNPSNNI